MPANWVSGVMALRVATDCTVRRAAWLQESPYSEHVCVHESAEESPQYLMEGERGAGRETGH